MIFNAYTNKELFDILIKTIHEDIKHQDYDRVVEVADWSTKMMTGDDQDVILIKYKRREDEEQQEQRVAVTNSKTQYVLHKVFNLFSEVSRSDRSVNKIAAETEDVTKSLETNIDHFHERLSLEAYLDEEFKYLNFYDPNAFMVIEFDNDNPINEKPVAYPYVVFSDEAVRYEHQRGTLQYLIAKTVEMLPNADKTQDDVKADKYTLYAKGVSWIAIDIPDSAEYSLPEGYDQIDLEDPKKTIYYIEFDTKSKLNPAVQMGYMRDRKTRLRTYVPVFYPAEKLLTDIIWKKSEYDLAHALHGFYQKFIYVDSCVECKGSGGVYDEEKEQQMACQICGGSGTASHTGTGDIIEIIRPKDKEDHIPLNEWVHYEQIPMDLIKQQKEDVKDLEKDIFNAVFGSNVLEKSEVAVTATEKHFDWRAVDNALQPYSKKYVFVYKDSVRTIADIRQEGESLIIEYAFPKSFNLESLDDKIARRAAALQANSPYAIIARIDLQILQEQYKDNPEFIQNYQAQEQLRPFNDKDSNETMMVLNMLPTYDPQRILYMYFDVIMADVWIANPAFGEMDFEKRRDIVKAVTLIKVTEVEVKGSLFNQSGDGF